MDLSNSTVKTPEAETETPTRIPPAKLSPFSNGLLKRHAPLHHLHHHHHGHHPVVVTYKECLKNHAAALGGHALDGCGEFMPASNSINSDPTSYKCAACGCHRNFHRRDPEDSPPLFHPPPPLEFYPHHRHHPARGGESGGDSPSDSPSPPPISSSYYPSAPHMLLSLSHGLATAPDGGITHIPAAIVNPTSTPASNSCGRKRFRTRFTQDQKEKMLELADRLGWRMQKKDEDLINEFCGEIGIDKGVFKVWMHNNKNTSGKNKDQHQLTLSNNSAVMSSPPAAAAVSNGTNYIDFRSSAAAAALYHQQDSNNDSCSKQEMNQLHLQD